jgi:hypothetical protein
MQVFEETSRDSEPLYQKAIVLWLGSYHLTTVVRGDSGSAIQNETAFEVK